MSVEFNETNPFKELPVTTNTGLTGWLIKKGWAKDNAGANKIMIVISIICLAVAVYFIIK